MRHVCVVTTELAPLTKGGIGVLIHNLLERFPSQSVQYHVILLGDRPADPATQHYFDSVRLYALDPTNWTAAEDGRIWPPREAFADTPWHWNSQQACRFLLQLERQGLHFDVIEFPDWGGLAFCSLQARLLGQGFETTEIAIRLHSSDSLLRAYEPRVPGVANSALCDIERKALRDADRVVAHLAPIAERNREFFGFEDAWLKKVSVEAPVVAPPCEAAKPIEVDLVTPLVFGSKIQEVKRPDVFVRAVIGLMRAQPRYAGKAYLLAHSFDGDYTSSIRSLVPSDLQQRVVFAESVDVRIRTQLVSRSIFVVPSVFESFCLAAYEASLSGAVVVLNERNPAFGDRTPWKHGKNCLKFDGTVLGLVNCLLSLLEQSSEASIPLELVDIQPDEPYWLRALGSCVAARGKALDNSPSPPLVSVVIPFFNLAAYLPIAVSSVLRNCHPAVEILIVDDCSDDLASQRLLESVEAVSDERSLRVLRMPTNVGLAAARNAGIKSARGSYVLTLDADDAIAPWFLEVAVTALERHPDFWGVVTQAARFSSDDDLSELRFGSYQAFVGEAVSTGIFLNRFSTATALFRREVLLRHAYDEAMSLFEDWDLFMRVVQDGGRLIVTNQVGFYYRMRQDSMINSACGYVPNARNLERLRAKHRGVAGAPLANSIADAQVAFLDLAQRANPMAPPTQVKSAGVHIVEVSVTELLGSAPGQFAVRLLGAINRRVPQLFAALYWMASPLRSWHRRVRERGAA